MNIQKKISVLILSVLLSLTNVVFASKLPNDVWKYVKEQLPQAKQRFDSVVTLNDDTMFIPLTPPAQVDVEQIKIEYSYPEGKTLKTGAQVVLLNNGYSFLKVFKDEKGNYSVTKKDDLPIKVRLGLMPQDMLTPIGLKMPESLKLTLGDLLIDGVVVFVASFHPNASVGRGAGLSGFTLPFVQSTTRDLQACGQHGDALSPLAFPTHVYFQKLTPSELKPMWQSSHLEA